MITPESVEALCARMSSAQTRYGVFSSVHEALGVGLEEWHELIAAVHDNDLKAVREECYDMAAVLIRLAQQLDIPGLVDRSIKQEGK